MSVTTITGKVPEDLRNTVLVSYISTIEHIVQSNVDGTEIVYSPVTPLYVLGKPYPLVTTPKLLIENNECLLPRTPVGDLAFDMALVAYQEDDEWVHEIYQDLEVVIVDKKPVLRFKCLEDLSGRYAIVSYVSDRPI